MDKKEKYIIHLDKSGQGRGGWSQRVKVIKYIHVNIINFARWIRGGGKSLIHKKGRICQAFVEPFPTYHFIISK